MKINLFFQHPHPNLLCRLFFLPLSSLTSCFFHFEIFQFIVFYIDKRSITAYFFEGITSNPHKQHKTCTVPMIIAQLYCFSIDPKGQIRPLPGK